MVGKLYPNFKKNRRGKPRRRASPDAAGRERAQDSEGPGASDRAAEPLSWGLQVGSARAHSYCGPQRQLHPEGW